LNNAFIFIILVSSKKKYKMETRKPFKKQGVTENPKE
jgi:hypothetical protein